MGMLNGTMYFAAFPDESPKRTEEGQVAKPRQLLSPELRTALEQLSKELENFLKAEERSST